MNEEIDLDHLGFTISSTDRPNPVQRIYLTKDEVRDTINEDFKRGGRKGTFRIDAFHECHWWYSPPAPEAKA